MTHTDMFFRKSQVAHVLLACACTQTPGDAVEELGAQSSALSFTSALSAPVDEHTLAIQAAVKSLAAPVSTLIPSAPTGPTGPTGPVVVPKLPVVPTGPVAPPGGSPSPAAAVKPHLAIVPAALRNATDAWSFQVAGAEVADVRWDFGDGATFQGLYAEHSYARRPQVDPFSRFLVRADVVYRSLGALGTMTVKFELKMPNDAVHARARGLTLVQSSHHPRFPQPDDKGVVSEVVSLWHSEALPLELDQVQITKHYRDGSTHVSSTPMLQFVGWGELEQDQERQFRVELDTRAEPDVTWVSYLVSGRGGKAPALGQFSLMIPVRPKASEVTFVESVEERQRIIAARRALRKPFVTSQEVEAVAASRANEKK